VEALHEPLGLRTACRFGYGVTGAVRGSIPHVGGIPSAYVVSASSPSTKRTSTTPSTYPNRK
jgi:hypothetical protein